MGRSGRKRKPAVRRQPNGQAHRPPADTRVIALTARHRHWQITMEQAKDQRGGYLLGVLNIKGHISDEEFQAGLRWAALVGRFARVFGIPMPTIKAASLEEGSRGQSLAPELEGEARVRLRREYDEAFGVLEDAGRHALVAVNECAVRDEVPLLLALREGLRALSVHFGIATKSGSCYGGRN